ncbi:MAG TPA: GDSL-type esterase/lipase family protein [Candidatus Limnocylindria bacterium]|nr:GDSL-type esterase/lipase family protein [Candidatus Limnocylindria bacterium]
MAPETPPVPIERLAGAWFIGDSQTAPFDLTGVLPGVEVEYDIGMSLRLLNETRAVRFDGERVRVEEKIRLKEPKSLYLWLGSNGIDRGPAEDVLAEFEILLQTIRGEFPLLPLYCVSATPVRRQAMERYPRYTPERILEFNRGLLELCGEYGAYYLDFHSLLVGEDGYMKIEYAAGDGIHLRYHTYELLRDYMLTHVAPMEGEELE